MSKLYLFIGLLVVVSLFGAYERHVGYQQRDAEMQAEIAKKNSEARETERALNEKLNQNATALQEANDVITEKQTALTRAINSGRVRLNSSCVPASSSASTAPSVGTPRPANLTERLSDLLLKSSPKGTETPSSLTPASQPTTK